MYFIKLKFDNSLKSITSQTLKPNLYYASIGDTKILWIPHKHFDPTFTLASSTFTTHSTWELLGRLISYSEPASQKTIRPITIINQKASGIDGVSNYWTGNTGQLPVNRYERWQKLRLKGQVMINSNLWLQTWMVLRLL